MPKDFFKNILIILLFILLSCDNKPISIKHNGITVRELSTSAHFYNNIDSNLQYYNFAFAVKGYSDSNITFVNTIAAGIINSYKDSALNPNIFVVFYRDTSLLEDKHMYHGDKSGIDFKRDELNVIAMFGYYKGKIEKYSEYYNDFKEYKLVNLIKPNNNNK